MYILKFICLSLNLIDEKNLLQLFIQIKLLSSKCIFMEEKLILNLFLESIIKIASCGILWVHLTRVHPPLLFGTVGILIYTKGILGDVVTLRRCARRCRFIRKASRKPACTRIPPPALIWSTSDLSGILHGNRHCIHRVRFQHRSGVAYHCVKKQH